MSLDEWVATDYEEMARVEWTRISPTCFVSTVWLGLDHNWSREGPPIIFETMTFGGRYDQEQMRYATEDQAQKGHREAVEMAARQYR
jgi:hypothetical protein